MTAMTDPMQNDDDTADELTDSDVVDPTELTDAENEEDKLVLAECEAAVSAGGSFHAYVHLTVGAMGGSISFGLETGAFQCMHAPECIPVHARNHARAYIRRSLRQVSRSTLKQVAKWLIRWT